MRSVFILVVLTGLSACSKLLDVEPGTELAAHQMYRNVYDANAAVMGIYGKFMDLSDRYIILNELRGDLMEYTDNADEYLQQISNHTVTSDNPYIDPRPFYELINNCNDVLKNFRIMLDTKKLSEQDFNQRYADIGCLRSFLYLQLGIHYGTVPYITVPLVNINDVAEFPRLPLETLLDSLILFTEALPYREIYTVDVGTSLNINLDGYQTERFFINKKILLGDLHLWKGNYRAAAGYYQDMLDYSSNSTNLTTRFNQYKIAWGSDNPTVISYTINGDASSLSYTAGWGGIFEAPDERFTYETIWALPYDSRFKPENPLIKLMSPIGGNYLVRPSQEIIDQWNNQQQRPVVFAGSLYGIPYDARGLLSVRTIGGQPVITKFISNYISLAAAMPVNPLVKNGKWFLFRAAHLHLRFAEAANRDGFPRLGYSFFCNGLRRVYAPPAGVTDVTIYQNTFHLPEPYQFDARMGEIPSYRGSWHRHDGLRIRANVTDYPITATTKEDSILQVETGIMAEQALETAFEGTRWPDLLRVAIRRNDPSFLADKVYDKLRKNAATAGMANAARAKLMAKDWFLPFKF